LKPQTRRLTLLLAARWPLFWGLSLLAFPFLFLLPLGLVWLWQHGWFLWWLLGAALIALLGYLPALRWQRQLRKRASNSAATPEAPVSKPDADWSPRDLEAWNAVQTVAGAIDKDIVRDQDRLLAAARQTIERVAQHYHPEDRDPVWSFTVPELLLLTERVSTRLRLVLLDHVPGVHLIEAGHLLRIWEYKPMANTGLRVFRHLHTAWRVTRLTNPMAALLAEARQHIVGVTLNEAGAYLRTQGARIWVEEVGRAAIELYSGRLRVDTERLRDHAAREGAGSDVAASTLPGPLRLLIAGQVNAGKSSLANALLDQFAAGVAPSRLTTRVSSYPLQREGLSEGLLLDTPGVAAKADLERLAERAWNSDLLIWVVAAPASDRTLDRAALQAVRDRFAADNRRTQLPIVVVASQIDRLLPEAEWEPPYSLEDPRRPQAAIVRTAVTALAEVLGVAPHEVIPARLAPPEQVYNVDRILTRLEALDPEAQRGRAQRLQLQHGSRDWKRVFRQAAGAGRLLKDRVLEARRRK